MFSALYTNRLSSKSKDLSNLKLIRFVDFGAHTQHIRIYISECIYKFNVLSKFEINFNE